LASAPVLSSGGQSGAGFYRFAETERIDVLRVIHTARSSDAWPT
jgi:plasmid stabilization system protein ParE